MSSFRQLLYHLVFRTKDSRPTIRSESADQLYAYITGIIKNKNSHLYRINGVENHLHICTDIHPSIALADFVKEIKVSSSLWMKNSGFFPDFNGWADGYAGLTCSYIDLIKVVEYVKNQKEHHSKRPFEEEYRSLLLEAGIHIDERFFP
jgi:REP element-mobilizing transposase RayT